MPDSQTINAIAGAYGASGLIGSGGGFNWWLIISGILFSFIGMLAFMYGKKEKSIRPMIIGAVLMIYPYIVPSALLATAIGIALTAALFLWRE